MKAKFKVGDRVKPNVLCYDMNDIPLEEVRGRGGKILKVCDSGSLLGEHSSTIYYITDGLSGHRGLWDDYAELVEQVLIKDDECEVVIKMGVSNGR